MKPRYYARIFTLQIVVIRVLGHPPVDEGPCEVVNCILLVLNCLGDYLCVEVVMEKVVQVRLQPTTQEKHRVERKQ